MTNTKALMIRTAAIAALTIAAGQTVREVVTQHVPLCHASSIDGCDRLRLFDSWFFVRTNNAGSAFGYHQGWWVWIVVAAFGLLLVPLYARRLRRVGWVAAAAVGLQIGGAGGNLLERFVFGHVTDYIPTPSGFVFDLADAALALGMVLAIIALFSRGAQGAKGAGSAVFQSGFQPR